MTKSGRYAGLLFFAIVFVSQMVGTVLRLITGSQAFIVLSLPEMVNQVGGLFFGGLADQVYVLPSMTVYAALIGLCLWILKRRVKAVEIVT
jgi:hypothetical protein